MNASRRKNPDIKQGGFSLVELLVVIAIIATLLAILLPVQSAARKQAKRVLVDHELYQIGLALDAYEVSNGTWPPVRPDCALGRSIYTIPPELVKGNYLPGRKKGSVTFSDIEDKYCKGYSYRYMAVGEGVKANGKAMPFPTILYIPEEFPTGLSRELLPYDDRKKCPIKWALFSLGPGFDVLQLQSKNWKGFPISDGYPVVRDYWYNPETKTGLLIRIKLSNDQYIGTFKKGR